MAAITWAEAIRRIYSLLKGAVDEYGKIEVSGGGGGAADEVTIINAPKNPVPVDVTFDRGGGIIDSWDGKVDAKITNTDVNPVPVDVKSTVNEGAEAGTSCGGGTITWGAGTTEVLVVNMPAEIPRVGNTYAVFVDNVATRVLTVTVENSLVGINYYPITTFVVEGGKKRCVLIQGLFAGYSNIRFNCTLASADSGNQTSITVMVA